MMRQVSSPVRWGAGRKGRQDLARSLPGFKVLEVLFHAYVSQAFLPSKKAGGIHKFRHFWVRQQYPDVFWWCCGSVLTLDSLPASSHVETQRNCVAVGSNFCSVLRGCGGTPHALLGSGSMCLGAVRWRPVLLVRVLRRLLHQGRLACVGHPLGVIRTQIPSVTRLTKGHPDGS